MNLSSPDAGIPELTEVIEAAPDVAPSVAATSAYSSSELLLPSEADGNRVEIKTLLSGSDEDWRRLERKIRERILRQLLARVDTALEQQVRDSLADVLQTAVESLANEIRNGLQHGIEDMVTRAVSQEITRLQTTAK